MKNISLIFFLISVLCFNKVFFTHITFDNIKLRNEKFKSKEVDNKKSLNSFSSLKPNGSKLENSSKSNNLTSKAKEQSKQSIDDQPLKSHLRKVNDDKELKPKSKPNHLLNKCNVLIRIKSLNNEYIARQENLDDPIILEISKEATDKRFLFKIIKLKNDFKDNTSSWFALRSVLKDDDITTVDDSIDQSEIKYFRFKEIEGGKIQLLNKSGEYVLRVEKDGKGQIGVAKMENITEQASWTIEFLKEDLSIDDNTNLSKILNCNISFTLKTLRNGKDDYITVKDDNTVSVSHVPSTIEAIPFGESYFVLKVGQNYIKSDISGTDKTLLKVDSHDGSTFSDEFLFILHKNSSTEDEVTIESKKKEGFFFYRTESEDQGALILENDVVVGGKWSVTLK